MTAMTQEPMTVEIWSDIICPWCWIGKRRFEKALDAFEHKDDVKIVHRTFRLMPGLQPQPIEEMMQKRFGPGAHTRMLGEVAEMAAREDLDYQLDGAQVGDTRDAQRLTLHAATKGLQQELVERLYKSYFTDRRSIFDRESLISIATEAGLDADEARKVLTTGAYEKEMEADLRRIQSTGVGGVPFFAFDSRLGVNGAQGPEHFLQALRQAWDTRAGAAAIAVAPDADGASCSVETGVCGPGEG